jgi:hypothetical protein
MANISFDQFARKTAERADKLLRAVGISLFSSVIRDTPVGDPDYWKGKAPKGYVGGRLRGNWNCSLRAPDVSTIEAPKTYNKAKDYRNFPVGQVVINKIENECEKANRKDSLWLANSLPYAQRVEYGWSRQRPDGMVRKNAARIKRIVSTQLRLLK